MQFKGELKCLLSKNYVHSGWYQREEKESWEGLNQPKNKVNAISLFSSQQYKVRYLQIWKTDLEKSSTFNSIPVIQSPGKLRNYCLCYTLATK